MPPGEVPRWHLKVQLATCGFGEWYAKLTGDEKTAAQFDRICQKMLAGLERERLALEADLISHALPAQPLPGWEQLPLI